MSLHWSNVRTRLTVWYVLALAGILIVYIASFMSLVFFSFRNNLDHNLEQDYEIVEEYISVDPAGTIQIESEHDPYFYERWFDLWSPDGKLLYASRPFSEQGIPPLNSGAATSAGFRFHSLKLPTGARVRIMSGKININGHWLTIRLIQSEDRLWHELKGFLKLLILILPVVLFIAGMGGYLLAKKFLDPIDQMAGKARQIGSRNLEERLPVLNPEDELGHLSQTINALLERLQESFERLKQFTSDAAHELRTPLTAIRSIGEVGLQSRKTQEEYQEMIGSILEENRRLTHLVDNLLFLSRIDAETFNVDPESIDSLELMNQTVDLIQPLAEEKGQKIRIRGRKSFPLTVNRTLLKQALLNLLDNAIKYSPDHSPITLQLQSDDPRFNRIQVIDQGPGIPQEQQTKIFQRFYRVDKGRSRELGGAGLGLSIAAWAIQIQGGEIQVDSQPGEGSVFTIVLPKQ